MPDTSGTVEPSKRRRSSGSTQRSDGVRPIGVDRPTSTRELSTEPLEQEEQTLFLHEEQLIPHKELHAVGDVEIRTVVEEIPGHLEVDLAREEIEVEHVPVGDFVKERVLPWEEHGVLTMPIYEEQLVVVKRLVLREYLKIRRVAVTERRSFDEPLRQERLVINDPTHGEFVHEQYATDADEEATQAAGNESAPREGEAKANNAHQEEGGFLERLARKVLE